jgi:hypothetical protein
VRLYFAELEGEVDAPGQRVFDVGLEGGAVALRNFDVYAAAGGTRIPVFEDLSVLVGDGSLTIDFVPVAGLPPMVAAVEVAEDTTDLAAPKLKFCGKNGKCH